MNQQRIWSWMAALLAGAMALAACGGAPPAQAPTSPPATPTAAAAATAVPTVAATAAPAPTEAPAARPGRGEGDTLRILYWQAPTILNTHLAVGTKDVDASRLVLEPLAAIDPEGNFVPLLAEEIPTAENGGVAQDFTSITWKLRKDIKWSDGSDFTAADVVFTYQYCADAKTACTSAAAFRGIKSVEAVDDYTVKVTWQAPNSYPYQVFTSQRGAILQKAQFEKCIGEAASTAADCQAANLSPIGTGPYKVAEFKPGDVVIYAINELYRDPERPFFKRVEPVSYTHL
ncbi:MAG: ABC transporter substrate-binding protein, partial [Chloroflexaceae bacterium]|nr:ABC transporter substrate-binding protein [Chloroflexaceae bacterium]